MKKVDIVSLLNGGASVGQEEEVKEIPKPKLVRQPIPTVQEHEPDAAKPRGINLKLIRSDVIKAIRACENPQVLLHVLSLLNSN